MMALDINEELDKLAISFVECYQEILFNRQLLNNDLDDAFLNLSKARSLIGCTSLSILQIPSEIEPSVFVRVDEDDDNRFQLSSGDDETGIQKNSCSWFGLFTPQSLKTSQKCFFKSMNVVVNLCNLQSKLKSIENDYKKALLEKKKKFVVNLEE